MSKSQRTFKVHENNTRYWNGKSQKFFSVMRNTDIQYSVINGWSKMIKDAKKSLELSKYNRDNNIRYVAMYNKNNTMYGRKRKKLINTREVS
jgi:hypothetical protein